MPRYPINLFFSLFLLVMCTSHSVLATTKTETVSDWRLERPVIHGVLSGLSFGIVDVGAKEWSVAHQLDPSGYPVATIKYLEKHRQLPYWFGFFIGSGVMFFVISAIIFYFFSGRAILKEYEKRQLEKESV